jgi:uncharacterized protein YaaN involved in tellurite resistance
MQKTMEGVSDEKKDLLSLPTIGNVKEQLVPADNSMLEIAVPDSVREKADPWIESVMSIGSRDLDEQQAAISQINSIGEDVELQLMQQSKLLQAPMSELMNDADNGSDVSNDLLKLEECARGIDPNDVDFSSVSGIRLFLAKLGLPTPLNQWVAKYQSTESIIKSIEEGLQKGKDKLKRDNITLKEDQTRYRKTLYLLDDYIAFTKYADDQFSLKLDEARDGDQKRFLTDEILFPTRQRHQDQLVSKAVYQQAWVTSEFVIKTNEELIRGVDRALKHTIVTLGVASSLAIALARQKKVLVALDASKKVTAKMIGDISDRLLDQGVSIMQHASEPYIQVEVMKSAFTKTLQAMSEVSSYRAKAVESMKTEIEDMRNMTSEMDGNIDRIEKGQSAQAKFSVSLT